MQTCNDIIAILLFFMYRVLGAYVNEMSPHN